jgi:hypothetical protein
MMKVVEQNKTSSSDVDNGRKNNDNVATGKLTVNYLRSFYVVHVSTVASLGFCPATISPVRFAQFALQHRRNTKYVSSVIF